jgi:hypothetical protein
MQQALSLWIRVIPASLILLGLTCALIAVFAPVSPRKGWTRLLSSVLVSAAFAVGSISQIVKDHRLWPGGYGLGAAVFLAWIGMRKRKRDPEGKTPAASML